MPIKWTLNNWTRLSFTPSPTLGQNKPTYRDGILKGGPARRHVICSSAWKSWKQYIKEEHLPKIINWNKPTVPVLVGIKMEEHPHYHQTPSRAVLASTRENIQAIQVMLRPVQKIHSCCISMGTLHRGVKSLNNTPRISMRSIHTRTRNPAPAAKNVPILSSSTTQRKRLTPWNLTMIPSQKKKNGKKQKKNPKSDRANADPSEDEHIYGIDSLNLGKSAHDS